jgi:hypothetical protein
MNETKEEKIVRHEQKELEHIVVFFKSKPHRARK